MSDDSKLTVRTLDRQTTLTREPRMGRHGLPWCIGRVPRFAIDGAGGYAYGIEVNLKNWSSIVFLGDRGLIASCIALFFFGVLWIFIISVNRRNLSNVYNVMAIVGKESSLQRLTSASFPDLYHIYVCPTVPLYEPNINSRDGQSVA